MKVIDLLNKMANNEDVPEKIVYEKETFTFNCEFRDYLGNHERNWLFDDFSIPAIINDEVEIIEEDKIIVEDKEGNKKEYFIKLNGGLKEGEKIFKQDNEWYVQKLVSPGSELYKWIEQFKPEIYYTLEDKTIEEDNKIETLELEPLDMKNDFQRQIEFVHYENIIIANKINEIIDKMKKE